MHNPHPSDAQRDAGHRIMTSPPYPSCHRQSPSQGWGATSSPLPMHPDIESQKNFPHAHRDRESARAPVASTARSSPIQRPGPGIPATFLSFRSRRGTIPTPAKHAMDSAAVPRSTPVLSSGLATTHCGCQCPSIVSCPPIPPEKQCSWFLCIRLVIFALRVPSRMRTKL
jgi:hypothetical protein